MGKAEASKLPSAQALGTADTRILPKRTPPGASMSPCYRSEISAARPGKADMAGYDARAN